MKNSELIGLLGKSLEEKDRLIGWNREAGFIDCLKVLVGTPSELAGCVCYWNHEQMGQFVTKLQTLLTFLGISSNEIGKNEPEEWWQEFISGDFKKFLPNGRCIDIYKVFGEIAQILKNR